MHSAPAVVFPVGRSVLGTLLSWLPGCLGLLVCGFWLLQSEVTTGLQAGVLLLAGLMLGPALWMTWRPLRGRIAWNGQEWSWEDGRGLRVGQVEVRLDLQNLLLLEFQPWQGRHLWLWPERRMAPAAWNELRRALYARRPAMPADAGRAR